MAESERTGNAELIRRDFLKGALGVAVGVVLFSTGAANRLLRFFSGPRMTGEEEARILADRRSRHREAAEEEGLEIERIGSDYLPIAKLSDLSATEGKYFYDYHMRPALAFLGKNGLPLLITAKCTHLGCTVGNIMDGHGRILCPCHLSRFDVLSGQPTEGPAVQPLAGLGWVLRDPEGKTVATKRPNGPLTGKLDPELAGKCEVFIARQFETEETS